MDMAREIFTTISGSWIHLKTDTEGEADDDGGVTLREKQSLTVSHGWLVRAVSLALPGLHTLGSSQAEGPHRGPGEGDSQVLLHPPLCAFYRDVLSSDSTIFQRDHKVAAPCREHKCVLWGQGVKHFCWFSSSFCFPVRARCVFAEFKYDVLCLLCKPNSEMDSSVTVYSRGS